MLVDFLEQAAIATCMSGLPAAHARLRAANQAHTHFTTQAAASKTAAATVLRECEAWAHGHEQSLAPLQSAAIVRPLVRATTDYLTNATDTALGLVVAVGTPQVGQL